MRMFGYIKPVICKLNKEEQQLYKATYCGLCHSLGKTCSQPARFTLNYDFVFLALIRMAALNETPVLTVSKCPSHPFKGCTVVQNSQSLDYCAAVSVLLGYESIQDKLLDEKGMSYYSALMCSHPYKQFLKKAQKKHDLPIDTVRNHLQSLHQLENSHCSTPDQPAEVFGQLLSEVSAHGIEDDLTRFAIQKIMFHIGKWIYMIDAADDFEKDKLKGNYNPFLPNGINAHHLANSLQWELSHCDLLINKLPCSDPKIFNIVENILLYGTESVAKAVLFPPPNSKKGIKKQHE